MNAPNTIGSSSAQISRPFTGRPWWNPSTPAASSSAGHMM